MAHEIDGQWQIDLVDMSKLSNHNDRFNFIMVVNDILSKYAWLEPLKSKHDIAIKNALEHIFSLAIRRPKGIQKDKRTESKEDGESLPIKKQHQAICNT